MGIETDYTKLSPEELEKRLAEAVNFGQVIGAYDPEGANMSLEHAHIMGAPLHLMQRVIEAVNASE